MHKNIKKIQKFEQRLIIKNFINQRDIEIFQNYMMNFQSK